MLPQTYKKKKTYFLDIPLSDKKNMFFQNFQTANIQTKNDNIDDRKQR